MLADVAIAGRFQPFHWGHFEYLIEAARHGGFLRVGITNPDVGRSRASSNDMNRAMESSNPFSYTMRREMVTSVVTEYKVGIEFDVVPCDLRSPALVRESMGEVGVVALTLYDRWSLEKLDVFRSAGYATRVLWTRDEKITSGSDIRRRIVERLDWQHLVPAPSANVVLRAI